MSSDESTPEVGDESCALASELEIVQNPSDEEQATQSSSTGTTESAPFESKQLREYTKRTKIGRGGFGVVFKAQHRIDKRWYAIKQVDPVKPVDAVDMNDTEQSRNKVLQEVHFLAELDHPHIVRYYGTWPEIPPPGEKLQWMESNKPCLYIRMEWCSGSTLQEWLGQNQLPEQRPISQTLDWFSQLVSAVKYIHDADLIHRDIKPQNIFFGSSRNRAASVLKIGDFGLAIDVASSSSSGVSKSLSIVGTEIYKSPEQPSGHYTNSTDIFSLGLVFLEMLYSFKTDRERCSAFGTLRANQRPAVMDKLDGGMDKLISWMTVFEPEKRASSNELDNELRKMTAEQLSELAKEIGAEPHAETNDGTDSNVKSETGTSSEHPDIGGPSIDDGAFEGINFTKPLPFKLALKIFGYLYEGDLTRCALVSREFRAIANHQILWKSLYQEVFEYSFPLLHVGHAQFEFREPHESIVLNPWKESFKQLKDGVHVRPGYAPLYSGFGAGGRRLTQCDRLDQALQLVEARDENAEKLIFLHTGLYIPETTVTINSDIQIIGASAGPDIASRVIIEGRLTTTVTLVKGSQGAYLGWMTVRFAPDPEVVAAAIAAGNSPTGTYHSALQICDDSTALVEHCVIHSSATVEAAICVKGSAANPRIQHCVVCDCENAGIYVTDAAQGQFEDCEIARNNHAGVGVNNRANPFFRRCHIHDCRNAGILMLDHGMGYFESCNIHNNRLSGIVVTNGANPTVTRCEVHHEQNGVYVRAKGRGQFTENRIHSNALPGIAIESHSDPTIRRNEIYNGLQNGVYVLKEGRGLIEENEVYGNTFPGIYVATGSNPKITRNKIRGNQGGGVLIHNNGQGVLEDNEIFDNAMAGVWIEIDGNPMLRRNKIYDGRGAGVYIFNKGRGVLEDNDIYRNAETGVLIKSESNPTLRGNRVYEGRAGGIWIESYSDPKITLNKIWDNQKDGVVVSNNGQGVLEENEIFDNTIAGVWIEADSNPMLRRNKIYDGRDAGVRISNKGRGVLEDNDIYRNALAGIEIASHSDPKIMHNKIWSSQSCGIFIHSNGQGVLEDNEIFDNTMAGVEIKTDGNPTLRRNKIYDGRGEGVYIFNKGRGVLEDNDIYRNAETGVLIKSESNPTIKGNRIYEGRATGIKIASHSDPKIASNKIRGNQGGGVLIHNNGQGVLEDNEIFDNAMAGVEIETDGNPTLRRNKIRSNQKDGAIVNNDGQGVLEDNEIFDNVEIERRSCSIQ